MVLTSEVVVVISACEWLLFNIKKWKKKYHNARTIPKIIMKKKKKHRQNQ